MTRRHPHLPAARGFTLLELVISVALTLVLMLAITRIFAITSSAVGASQGLSAATRDARAAQAVFSRDIGSLASDSPFIIIHGFMQAGFRNLEDQKTDLDYNPASVINSSSASGNLATLATIRTVDPDEDGVETDYGLLTLNNRNHRTDAFVFFARDRFARATGNDDGALVSRMSSPEAMIWYGHLCLAHNSGTFRLGGGATGTKTRPGFGNSSQNPNNFFASQWMLGRVATLLVKPTALGAAGIIRDDNNVPQDFYFRGAGAAAGSLSPLSDGANATVQKTTEPHTNIDARYDLAGTDISTFNNYAKAATGNWWENFRISTWSTTSTSSPYEINPFLIKPISPKNASQQVPSLVPSCSQFIVEFAGDFVSQDANGGFIARTPNADGTMPDGTIDFVQNAVTGVRQIRWYGVPRDTNQDGIIRGADGDVVPVSDVAGSQMPFERVLVTTGNSITPLTGDYNKPPVAATVKAAPEYTAAWGPTNVNRPKLYRITLAVDRPEMAGRTAEALPFEFVIAAPEGPPVQTVPCGVPRRAVRSFRMIRNSLDFRQSARRDERGSVLIFVIGVLLLLAIIATAFLGTSRSDRTATQQNAYNTQIDLLLEGVQNALKGAILADARFQSGANGTDSYTLDKYLAQRVPVTFDPTQITANAAASPPTWAFITESLLDASFSYPMQPAKLLTDNSPGYSKAPPATYSSRQNLVATSIKFGDQTLPAFVLNQNAETDPVTGVAPSYPEKAYSVDNAQVPVPAMDADGDGIADSGMVKLQLGPIAGVTYYYGARVIDAGSALNFNVANGWNEGATANTIVPSTGGTALPGNYFPTNIDLYDALTGTTTDRDNQLNRATNANGEPGLNGYRLGLSRLTDSTIAVNGLPQDDNAQIPSTASPRNDYLFSNDSELLWMQFARRLGNPGYIAPTATDIRKGQLFDINNTVSLARNFVIRESVTPSTPIEKALVVATQGGSTNVPLVPTKPYAASDVLKWFNNNFAYPPASPADQNMPLRALLTGNNPSGIDGLTLAPGADKGLYDGGATYQFGDVVSFGSRKFLCIVPEISGSSPGTLIGQQHWSLLGWVLNMGKVSINTADFGELWWGFRRLMSKDGSSVSTAATSPFPIISASTVPTAAEKAKWRMYRNVIRDPLSLDPAVTANPSSPSTGLGRAGGGRFMTSSEVLQLRSALAAVNAMDLRDTDDNITARRIKTANFTSPVGQKARHDVTVFGTERQPYITEVYVNTDNVTTTGAVGAGANPKGYVAIELYNPYPVALNLDGWAIGVIDRRMGTDPAAIPAPPTFPLTIKPLDTLATARFDNVASPTVPLVVPANGYLVLENFKANIADTTAPGANDALHRPTGAGSAAIAGFKHIPNLDRVLFDTTAGAPAYANGGELVLLRPRKADLALPAGGTPAYTTTVQPNDPVDPCDEGSAVAPNLYDMVPVDSFDFTNMNVAPVGPPAFFVHHYIRENTPDQWRWTMGRTYRVTAAPQTQTRQGGSVGFAGGPEPTVVGGPVALGTVDALGIPTDAHLVGVAVNAPDWPSPRPVAGGGKSLFGARGFIRDADILKVPTIGSYKVLTLASAASTTVDGTPLPNVTSAQADSTAGPEYFTEMNALPMDEYFADDEDGTELVPNATNNDVEQVGRLCPLSQLDPVTYADYPKGVSPTATANDKPYGSGTVPFDWYDPNFNFEAVQALTVGTRSIFDIFTATDHNNALPSVSAEEYELMWRGPNKEPKTTPPANPLFVPTYSSPTSASRPANITYGVASSGSGSTITMVNTLPKPGASATSGVNYAGCVIQVLTGPGRGQIVAIGGTPSDDVVSGTTRTFTLATPLVTPLTNGDIFRILGTTDDPVVSQGLININTAPWYVLDRLPMVVDGATGQVNRIANSNLAKAIVLYRDGNPMVTGTSPDAIYQRTPHGPFTSIADLNRLLSSPGSGAPFAVFQSSYDTSFDPKAPPKKFGGDITPDPNGTGPTGVSGDFESRYLALSRISNLITTRSDAFVVYVTLQGWRDAGTPTARLVTQRRAAFIVDRSGATLSAPSLANTRIPIN